MCYKIYIHKNNTVIEVLERYSIPFFSPSFLSLSSFLPSHFLPRILKCSVTSKHLFKCKLQSVWLPFTVRVPFCRKWKLNVTINKSTKGSSRFIAWGREIDLTQGLRGYWVSQTQTALQLHHSLCMSLSKLIKQNIFLWKVRITLCIFKCNCED